MHRCLDILEHSKSYTYTLFHAGIPLQWSGRGRGSPGEDEAENLPASGDAWCNG